MGLQTARQAMAKIEELAQVSWVHPAWWGTLALMLWPGSAAGHELQGYRNANSHPETDTWMAHPLPLPDSQAAGVARAVLRARRALDALRQLEGTLEDQPLLRHLVWQGPWLTQTPLPQADHQVVFLLGERRFLATLRPGDEVRVTAELAQIAASMPSTSTSLSEIPADARVPMPAAVAIALEPTTLTAAHHLHRRAWTHGGGPWLGVSDVAGWGVVSTCHLAVDGYGHVLLSSKILGATDQSSDLLARLESVARERLGDRQSGLPAAESDSCFAGRLIPRHSFRACAYAFGRALEQVFRAEEPPHLRLRHRFSPVFQVPVAPGERHDPQRVTRRTRHALLSLRMNTGVFEPFAEFAQRVPGLLAAELAGGGLLANLAQAVAGAPLPAAWRQRLLLTHHRPRRWVPVYDVLCGRGRLSSLSFPTATELPCPLYAASAPPLADSAHDPRGSLVLTLIHHPDQVTASVLGTGWITAAGAERFLDLWQAELARLDSA